MSGRRDDPAVLSGRGALVRAAVSCLVMFRLTCDGLAAAGGTLCSRQGRHVFCTRWRDRRTGVLIAMVDRLILAFDHRDLAPRVPVPF